MSNDYETPTAINYPRPKETFCDKLRQAISKEHIGKVPEYEMIQEMKTQPIIISPVVLSYPPVDKQSIMVSIDGILISPIYYNISHRKIYFGIGVQNQGIGIEGIHTINITYSKERTK